MTVVRMGLRQFSQAYRLELNSVKGFGACEEMKHGDDALVGATQPKEQGDHPMFNRSQWHFWDDLILGLFALFLSLITKARIDSG